MLNMPKEWPPTWDWPEWEPFEWHGREESLTVTDVYQPDIEADTAADVAVIVGHR